MNAPAFSPNRSGELGGAILASVSRSFYLSIKVLPPKVRGPIGLAYLLARTADTIADASALPAALRQKHLQAFDGMIHTGIDFEKMLILQREIIPASESERALLKQMEPCLDWLASLPLEDRADIVNVLEKIISGQSLDITRFPDVTEPRALHNAEELDDYTYLVAGCVGDFWTRICKRHLANFSAMELEPLCEIGVNFGKGLQLVNILRDLPADLLAGRCYLPADELAAAGADPLALVQTAELARPVFERWREKAAAHLEDGYKYIEALGSWRVRVACILPWAIGTRTLALMGKTYPLTAAARVKVPRSEVRKVMFHALCAAPSNAMLRSMRCCGRASAAPSGAQPAVLERK